MHAVAVSTRQFGGVQGLVRLDEDLCVAVHGPFSKGATDADANPTVVPFVGHWLVHLENDLATEGIQFLLAWCDGFGGVDNGSTNGCANE